MHQATTTRPQMRRSTIHDLDTLADLHHSEDDEEDAQSTVASSTPADGRDSDSEGEVWEPEKSEEAEAEEKRLHTRAVMRAAILTVVAGCTSCVPFELLNKADRGCSDLILFAQYVYAFCEVLACGDVRKFLSHRQMPLRCHLYTLVFERARNTLYNMAVNMALPMPVYLVLKNSGLVVSMFLGATVQGRKYTSIQVLGVFGITVGVISACFACKPAPKENSAELELDTPTFMFATCLMVGGVVVTAFMNVVQESSFNTHGKHYQETVFYANMVGLPLFLFNANGMMSHVRTWNSTWGALPLPAPLNVQVPYLWLLLFVNIASQSVMKMSCLKLTGLAGSVPNVVTVTVFRFVSLVLSACVMNSPPFPPPTFWIGGVLVLSGTLGYALAGASSAKKGSRKSKKA